MYWVSFLNEVVGMRRMAFKKRCTVFKTGINYIIRSQIG